MVSEKVKVTPRGNQGKPTVSKVDLLWYIWQKGVVEAADLCIALDFRYSTAKVRLSKLKKRGLVINQTRGHWTVTNKGRDRLVYAGRKV